MLNNENPALVQRKTIAVWLIDQEYTSKNLMNNVKVQLEQIVTNLTIFEDVHKYLDYLCQLVNEQIVLILHVSNHEQVADHIKSLPNLRRVYILFPAQIINEPWGIPRPTFSYTYVNLPQLCERIRVDLYDADFDFDVITSDTISLSLPSSSSETPNLQDSTFFHAQLLKYVLAGICYSPDDLKQMIDYLKRQCENQQKDLEKIDEFASNYSLNKAVWYYTQHVFLYQRVNAALRTLDVSTIYNMGIYIRDLHHQIVHLHRNTFQNNSTRLYRGLQMPVSVFEEKLKGKEGALLSINEFWSTSTDPEVAQIFAHRSRDDYVVIVFCIDIDPSVPTSVAYANIQHMGQFKDEEEYLFTMCSVFRIESIERGADAVWYVSLRLTNDRDTELQSLINFYRSLRPVPSFVSLYEIMLRMGRYKEILELSEARKKPTDSIFDLLAINRVRGFAHLGMGFYQEALKQFEAVVTFWEDLSLSIEDPPTVITARSIIFWLRGDSDLALSSLQEAINREAANPTLIDHGEILTSFRSVMSEILIAQGHSVDATFQIQAEEQAHRNLSPKLDSFMYKSNFVWSLLNLGTGNNDAAAELAKKALTSLRRTEVPDHPLRNQAEIISSVVETIVNKESPLACFCRNPHSAISQSTRMDYPAALMAQVQKHIFEMRCDEALSIIDEYLRLGEDQTELGNMALCKVYLLKGFCYFMKQELSEALPSFQAVERYASQDSRYTRPLISLARLCICLIRTVEMYDDKVMGIVEETDISAVNGLDDFWKSTHNLCLMMIFMSFQLRALACCQAESPQEAIDLLKKSLKVGLKFLPSNHPKLAETHEFIASLLKPMNSLSEALAHYHKARIIWEQCLPGSETFAPLASSLGEYLESQMQQLCQLHFPDLDIEYLFPNTCRCDFPVLLKNYISIGEISLVQENFIDAIVYYQFALDLQGQHQFLSDYEVANLWMKLGDAYESAEMQQDALEVYSNALQFHLSMIAPDPQEFSKTYRSMGFICIDVKQYDDALSHFLDCLKIEMLSLKDDDLALADAHRCIGLTLKLQGNYADASLYLQRSLEIQRRHLPSSHRSVQGIQKMLQECSQTSQGASAIPDVGKKQSIVQPSHVAKEPDANATHHRSIAMESLRNKRYKEGVWHLEQCLNIQLHSLPSDHPNLAETYSSIADAMVKSHELSNAIKYYQSALDILGKHLPRTSLQMIDAWLNFGDVHLRLDQFKESIQAYTEALAIQMNTLSFGHIHIAKTYKKIGLVNYVDGNYADALSSFEECLKIQIMVLPSNDPELIDTQSRVEDLYHDLNNGLP